MNARLSRGGCVLHAYIERYRVDPIKRGVIPEKFA